MGGGRDDRAEGQESAFDLLHPGLRRWIVENWSGSGSADLKEIQQAAIPIILAGHDCILEAPTAGGKTEAVLFPVLTRVAATRRPGVRVLYLAPLRALLNNLEGRGEKYASACGLYASKWHGDVSQKAKVGQLRQPPQLLLTTPESVEAILLRKAEWAEFFGGLDCVIIDEAHNFASGDRGGHLLSLIERVSRAAPQPPQRIAMTATIGNPEAMLDWLAGSARSRGLRVHVPGQDKERDYRVHYFDAGVDDDQTPAEQRAGYRRFLGLHQELVRKRCIAFVRRRKDAEQYAKAFVETNRSGSLDPVSVRTHHSNVSRYFREEAEALIQIKNEHGINAIFSTSTLELGIDIGALDSVIQLDGLASPGSFLQRVGRTGRRPGVPQVFRGFCLKEDDLVLLTATVCLGLQGKSEALHFPRRAFHLLAHQLICLSLQSLGVGPDRAWATLRHAHCFEGIEEAEFRALVDHMVQFDYLRWAGAELVVGARTEKQFLGAGWRRLFAVFDSAPLYEVLDQKTPVGTLDAGFVQTLEAPFHFVLGGRLWEARSVDHKGRRVRARRAWDGEAPRWNNFGGPDVPFETAQEAGRLLRVDDAPRFLTAEALEGLANARWCASKVPWEPGDVRVLVSAGGKAHVWSYAGDRINRTIARLLVALGLGNATAGYHRVEIKVGAGDPDEQKAAIERGLARAGRGDLSLPGSLESLLASGQGRWAFSPFARCLPDRLWAEALVEQALDCRGTVTYLARAAAEA